MKTTLTLLVLLSACDGADPASPRTDADTVPTADTASVDTADAATADSSGPVPDGTDPTSDRLPASVAFVDPSELLVIVPDLDGDGRDDVLVSTPQSSQVVVHTHWPDDSGTGLGYVREGVDLVTAVGDLNHDGLSDLVVGSSWDHRVEVYFGPFDGVAKPRSASFHLARDPNGGLADRFGATLLVGDLGGDGKDDLLVSAPGEGEEACFGTRSTLIYFGPLVAGPGSTVDGMMPVDDDEDDGPAPSRILPATPGVCLGDHAFVLPASRGEALVLSTSRDPGRVAYGLPLSAQAMPLTEANTPPLPDLTDRIDVDGDHIADTAAFDPETGGLAWTRSRDGGRLSLAQGGHHTRLVGIDLTGDGVGAAWVLAERWVAAGYYYDVTLAPLDETATGLIDFATLSPGWSGRRSGRNGGLMSHGDLDGDGVPEVVIGNALIRHQRAR
jgi:hypothetical protein